MEKVEWREERGKKGQRRGQVERKRQRAGGGGESIKLLRGNGQSSQGLFFSGGSREANMAIPPLRCVNGTPPTGSDNCF